MPQGRAGATGGPLKAFRSTPLQTDACKWLPGCRRTFPRALVKRVASLRDSLARLDDAKKVSGDRAGAVAQHFGDWVVVAFTEPTCEAPEGILRSELNIFDADMPDAPCAWTEVLDTMDLESDAPPPPPDDCRQVVDTMGTTRGDFRASFLHSLRAGGIWKPPAVRPPSHQTLMIFDWDDTLLCSSVLMHRPWVQSTSPQLKAVAEATRALLELALRLGHTVIVTNADGGWVEQSAKRYMPSVLPVLERIRVISARELHAARHPLEANQWKVNTFLELEAELEPDAVANVVVIGDAMFEMNAANALRSVRQRGVIKTVKLQESPSLLELRRELEFVRHELPRIFESGQDIAVDVRCELLEVAKTPGSDQPLDKGPASRFDSQRCG
mmetsp:Transcript_44109/g.122129  ORF Transcript_44109/g.122129 Transcript_44109/m.122129 type:complete len:385 (-) Transcript_44109:38-1192(-)